MAGTITVAVITFAEIPIGSWDSGLVALGPNLIVMAVVELMVRATRRNSPAVPAVTPTGA